MTEKAFQASVIQLARLCRWHVYHTHDSRRSAPGFPDLCLAKSGRVIHVELKSERGRISSAQAGWIAALDAQIWRPSDWPTIEAVLTG